MIFILSLVSIGAAFIGLYYLICAAKAAGAYEKAEATGSAMLLVIISTLALVASYIGEMK